MADEGTNRRSSVAIIGAGPSGLSAAHHLADSHSVYLFDAKSKIGGVWAKESDPSMSCQAYDWLETNTPRALFAYPGFPMRIESDKKDSNGPFVSSNEAKDYFEHFASQNRLFDDRDKCGRLSALRLGERVSDVRQENVKGRAKWKFASTSLNRCTEPTMWTVDKLVFAIGSFSEANVPLPFAPVVHVEPFNKYIMHIDQLQNAGNIARLELAKRVIVIGTGKSALDLIARLQSSKTASIPQIILFQKEGALEGEEKVPRVWSVWPSLRTAMAAHLAGSRLLGAGYLSPWMQSQNINLEHEDRPVFVSQFLQQTRLGQMLVRMLWYMLAWMISSMYPQLYSPFKKRSLGILAQSARIFPSPFGLQQALRSVDIKHTEVISIEIVDNQHVQIKCKDRSESLSINGEQGHDMVVFCTGYKGADDSISCLFRHKEQATALGIPSCDGKGKCGSIDHDPLHKEWKIAKERAFHRLFEAVPLLHTLCACRGDTLDGELPTFRLYNHIIPLDDVLDINATLRPPFVVLGLPQTLSAPVIADLQARFVKVWFSPQGERMRRAKMVNEATDRTAMLVAASVARYGCRDSRKGTTMAFELAWYADHLMDHISDFERQSGMAARNKMRTKYFRQMQANDWR